MDSHKTLATARQDVFGKDPVLGTDGLPLERGVGSHWHRSHHIQKAHYHAAAAWAGTDDLVSSAKALLATAEKIAAAAKASIEAAALARDDAPTPPDVKESPEYKALKDQYDQAVAERDVLTRVPAATAHNVARDADEQVLLDEHRATKKRNAEALAAEKAKAEAAKTPVVPRETLLPPGGATRLTPADLPSESEPTLTPDQRNLSFAVPAEK